MAEYWVSGGAGVIGSGFKTKESSGVMDCHDMDLFANESIYDSIGALDHFAHGGIVDLWNDTPGLRQRGQPFSGCDQSLGNKLGVVRGILRNVLLN